MGTLLLLIAEKNLAKGNQKDFLELLFMYSASLIVVQFAIILTEYSFTNKQHTYEFYLLSLTIYSFLIVAFRNAADHKYAATIIAALFILHRLLIIWILPLFEAEPLLGPIYRDVDHYVAPYFPVLLFIPALGVDILHHKIKSSNRIVKTSIIGVCFCITFFVVQWNFAEFLLSEKARNWFFAADNNFPYWVRMGERSYEFWFEEWTPYGQKSELKKITLGNFGLLTVFTIICSYLGSFFGTWIRQIKR
ncbi:MAG: hypothetical protein CM1200mP10_10000 [Candidatus Neomarinimicrobiota bacterium]|nr:MAG: hypothetical protein CM1200mP10_10000 [Candidatus Neomarinimicrobiota bacterium]